MSEPVLRMLREALTAGGEQTAYVTVSPHVIHIPAMGTASATVNFAPPPGLPPDGELVAVRFLDRSTAAGDVAGGVDGARANPGTRSAAGAGGA